MELRWWCERCGERYPVTWREPESFPPPNCACCGCPTVLRQACENCRGEGYVEATQWAPPNAGPCGECRGTGLEQGETDAV